MSTKDDQRSDLLGQEPRSNSTSDAAGGGGAGGLLEAQIRSLPIASLRRNYAQAIMDWADTDTAVRLAARRVLSEFEVEGDSNGVPMIEDIVDLLVARLEGVAGGRDGACEQSGAGSQTDPNSATPSRVAGQRAPSELTPASEPRLPRGSAFDSSALVLLLARWRDIAEQHVLTVNKTTVSAYAQIEMLAYARGIHDLANRIEDELRRAGEKQNAGISDGAPPSP